MLTYTTPANRTITTVRELGKGGEGIVYEVGGHSDLVAKIYHQSLRNVDRERKLQAMIINPPQDDTRSLSPPHVSIAWPTDLLYEQGRFAGYLMPRLSQSPDIFEIYNPHMRARKYPTLDWRHLHRVARNLATALNALHSSGYVMGDVNQKNVLVTGSALVTLVDTDSFQVRGSNGNVFRCSLGVPEYTPPELHRVRLDSVDRVPAQDHFGLAVVIFQLLVEGFHPFTGAPNDPTMSVVGEIYLHCIKSGIFPYEKNKDFAPPPNSPAFTTLHPELQKAFLRCFVDGYKNPSARPTAREWIDLLNGAELALAQCKKNSAHWYSNHVKRCSWCERETARSKATAARQPQIPIQTTFQTTFQTRTPMLQQQAVAQTASQVQRPSLTFGEALNTFVTRPFLIGVLCWLSLGVTSCIKVSWVRLADFSYRNAFFTESIHNDGWFGGFWIGIAAGIAWGIARLTKRRVWSVLVGLFAVGAMMVFLFSLPHSGRWGTNASAIALGAAPASCAYQEQDLHDGRWQKRLVIPPGTWYDSGLVINKSLFVGGKKFAIIVGVDDSYDFTQTDGMFRRGPRANSSGTVEISVGTQTTHFDFSTAPTGNKVLMVDLSGTGRIKFRTNDTSCMVVTVIFRRTK